MSKKNIADRMGFYKLHRNWTAADWGKVLWSDETQVKQFSSHRLLVRRPKYERNTPRYVVSSVRSSSSAMIWTVISAEGRAGIHVFGKGGSMKAAKYLELIKKKVLLWLPMRN